MKKVIDLAAIERREQELEDELAKLRAIKKYATRFGADYGQPGNGVEAVPDMLSVAAVEQPIRTVILTFGQEEFNYQTIEKLLVETGNTISRSSIFDWISTLKEKGEIEVIRKGAGRRPAQYKATAQFSPF